VFFHVSPKPGYYGNRRPFAEPYLVYSSGSPVRKPSPGSPSTAHSEMPHSYSSPLLIFQSPVCESPSSFPCVAPIEGEARFQILLLHILQGPQVQEPPLQVPLTEFPQRERRFTSRAPSSISQVLVNEPPSKLSNGSATERDTRLHFPLLGACRL
jgi:hypothetical protein